MSVFNRAASNAAKAAGMTLVGYGASPAWSAQMAIYVVATARSKRYFTSDDVYRVAYASGLTGGTRDERAFGPVMLRAAKAGICRKADRPPINSQRVTLHSSPRSVWESLIYYTNDDPLASEQQQGVALMSDITIPGFAWSYSTLKNFETCARRYNEYNVAKTVREPESDAIKQGHAVHEAFNARLMVGTPLPLGMGMHEGMLAKFADAPGKTYGEQKLAISSDFKPATWFGKNVWFRSVVDAIKLRETGDVATVVDWKTGKPDTDTTQLKLSAAVIMAHHPRITRVDAALFFINYEQTELTSVAREDLTQLWADILPRVRKMVAARQAQNYPPNPSGLCRRYCAVASCPFHGK